MMIDYSLLYSDDQAITATAASTNTVDQVKAGGPYQGARLVVKCSESFDLLTSLGIAFQTSADGSTWETLVEKTVLLADLTANSELLNIDVPAQLKEYTRVNYTVTGTAPTTGKVWAGIAVDSQVGV